MVWCRSQAMTAASARRSIGIILVRATVPLPTGAADDDLIVWVGQVLESLYAPEPAPASASAPASGAPSA